MASERHLVVKRGHKGRYRFVLIDGDERIGGEVYVGDSDASRDGSHALALARIARLAEGLLQDLTSRAPAQTGLRSEVAAKTCVADLGRRGELGEGGLHG